MELPNLSNSMYVARLRYIQSIHESQECRNPDTLVRHFIPFIDRVRATWLDRRQLKRLRADPFYYYIVARTKYYDQVIHDSVTNGVQRIVGVGCGSDTRAYRFEELLRSRGVTVLECDQPDAIRAKQRLTKSWRRLREIEYLGLDLNDGAWPDLERWLDCNPKAKTLFMLEGVSPYVDEGAFGSFLRLLASRLAAGSRIAYDFKISGVKDDFGREGRTQRPFRLPRIREDVAAYHRAHNLALEHMELSSELSTRLLPSLRASDVSLFDEDGLVRLSVING